jgi:hypothetical protein
MPAIPSDEKFNDKKNTLSPPSDEKKINKPSVLAFREPIPDFIAIPLLQLVMNDFLPYLQKTNPDISINPLYSELHQLVGIDFGITITPKIRNIIVKQINKYAIQIQQTDLKNAGLSGKELRKKPTSFLDMLGTYRVSLNRYYIPLLICIISATFLAWLSWSVAGIEVSAAPVSEQQYGFWAILLNGLIPVLIGASFITIIWLVVRKKGLGIFRTLMGIFTLIYIWFGFSYYVDVLVVIYSNFFTSFDTLFVIGYYVLFFGSMVFLFFVGIMFFQNRLTASQKNAIVLIFGIFLGSILGVSFPTWSLFSLIIFLSIWDLIAVFKGPLGKIADLITQNRNDMINKQQEMQKLHKNETKDLAKSESQSDQTKESPLSPNTSSQSSLPPAELSEMDSKYIKAHLNEIEVEIGSGDLIFYSVLVAHTFVSTGNWLITGLVIFGVIFGAYLTLQRLIQNKRVLPALPFSMFIGIGMYFLGELIVWFFSL